MTPQMAGLLGGGEVVHVYTCVCTCEVPDTAGRCLKLGTVPMEGAGGSGNPGDPTH